MGVERVTGFLAASSGLTVSFAVCTYLNVPWSGVALGAAFSVLTLGAFVALLVAGKGKQGNQSEQNRP